MRIPCIHITRHGTSQCHRHSQTCLLQDAQTGKLLLLSCARPLLKEAIAKIKAKCHITQNGDKPTEIYTCGLGCSQFEPTLNKELNVK